MTRTKALPEVKSQCSHGHGLMMTIYKFMSPRRQQKIRESLHVATVVAG